MRADEADIHVLRSEFDDHNKPEIVTFDVKHIVLVSDEINRIEGLLQYIADTASCKGVYLSS